MWRRCCASIGIEGLSSSQVSRAAALLEEEPEAWRTRPLGEIRYLIARRDRRNMGLRQQSLHQMASPRCLIHAHLNFQISGCAIDAPGDWTFHCHLLYCMHGGMILNRVILNLAEGQIRSGRDGYSWDGEGGRTA